MANPKKLRGAPIAIAAALLAASCSVPQRNNPIEEAAPPTARVCAKDADVAPAELRAKPGYRQVSVSVTDASGSFVSALDKTSFKISEHRQPRPVEFFRRDGATPLSVGILIDTSGSMESKLPNARKAVERFVAELGPTDEVFLFAFSDRPHFLQPFTTDRALFGEQLEKLQAFGRTALYDVILSGLEEVQRGCHEEKALLVITDGVDTASKASLDTVKAKTVQANVPVYFIGIGEWENPLGRPVRTTIPMGPRNQERVDINTLQPLAAASGAKSFLVGEDAKEKELLKTVRQIAAELRHQYTIGYVSQDGQGSADLGIEIVNHPGAIAHVRGLVARATQ